tara:strand:+ start:122 stop:334 length:213 start_codon:yes stop_codon:yes gene_type:complete
MKNSQPNITDYQVKKKRKSILENKITKTTNVNVLLNRVRLEKKDESKKKIILSLVIISILSFISIISLGN